MPPALPSRVKELGSHLAPQRLKSRLCSNIYSPTKRQYFSKKVLHPPTVSRRAPAVHFLYFHGWFLSQFDVLPSYWCRLREGRREFGGEGNVSQLKSAGKHNTDSIFFLPFFVPRTGNAASFNWMQSEVGEGGPRRVTNRSNKNKRAFSFYKPPGLILQLAFACCEIDDALAPTCVYVCVVQTLTAVYNVTLHGRCIDQIRKHFQPLSIFHGSHNESASFVDSRRSGNHRRRRRGEETRLRAVNSGRCRCCDTKRTPP